MSTERVLKTNFVLRGKGKCNLALPGTEKTSLYRAWVRHSPRARYRSAHGRYVAAILFLVWLFKIWIYCVFDLRSKQGQESHRHSFDTNFDARQMCVKLVMALPIHLVHVIARQEQSNVSWIYHTFSPCQRRGQIYQYLWLQLWLSWKAFKDWDAMHSCFCEKVGLWDKRGQNGLKLQCTTPAYFTQYQRTNIRFVCTSLSTVPARHELCVHTKEIFPTSLCVTCPPRVNRLFLNMTLLGL